MTGLYIHIPYCLRKCGYCDFYSLTDTSSISSYTDAVISYLDTQPFGNREVDTIYFGGGTPNLLGAENLDRILAKIKKSFSVSPLAEISLEANPESIKPEMLSHLYESGFNRISFGVQSAIDRELGFLNRQHNTQQSKDAVLAAKEAGFKNISADLMLGIPHQTLGSLEKSIDFLLSLPINHISSYILKIEPETPFFNNGMEKFCVSDEEVADFYLFTVDKITAAGFSQYEISNFAKENGISRHNYKYWNLDYYIGIGPSAHSYIDGSRFSFPTDLKGFIKSAGNWDSVNSGGDGGDFVEYAMLRLRLRPGLDLDQCKKLYPQTPIDKILSRSQSMVEDGLLEIDNMTLSFTAKGFLVSNFLIADLLF